MKSKLLFLIMTILFSNTFSQLVTWNPVFATANDSIVVVFDATQGNRGLQGFTGDVYAHTGVITNLSTSNTDWRYVKTSWGQNTPETMLERIGTDLYRIVIRPSVRSFYNVNPAETILQIAFVFRSALPPYREGKTADGGDIFVPLAAAGLNVAITSPIERPLIRILNDNINIQVSSVNSTNLALFDGTTLLTQTTGTALSFNYVASTHGKKIIRAVATGTGGATRTDSFALVIRPPVTVQALPAGMRDGVNYTSVVTATLVLTAPEKQFVYVIGDFNNWEVEPNFYMKRTPDGQKYWLELTGLAPALEYAYQYLVDGTIRVADPYAEKILDPWNDRFIPASTYPGLKPYPTGKTTNIVSVLQTAQAQYQWQVTNFRKPKIEDLVFYELLIRDFTTLRTYKSIQDTLSYFKRLGVNALKIMPVMEFEGNESWGYNPMFMFAPDKYYGTKNDLKRLIDEAHKQGIAIILDIVLNHQFGNSPLVRMYWDALNNRPAANSPWFNTVARHPFNVGFDMNHESQFTRDFSDRVIEHWITEYKVDGYRFDLSKGFTQVNSGGDVGLWGRYDQSRINIWKRIADRIWALDSTSIVILEHFADDNEEQVLTNYGMLTWGNMNHAYNEATMGWNASSDFSRISHRARGFSKPHLIGYMESHDEERLMYRNILYGNVSGNYSTRNISTALDRMKLAAAFLFTVPGPKMLWQFGELGYDFSINTCPNFTVSPDCRTANKPVRWDYYSDPDRLRLFKVYSELIKLKINHDVFETNDFSLMLNGATKQITLNHPSMNVLIVGNFDVVNRTMTPLFPRTGKWYDFFSGDSITVGTSAQSFSLFPGQFNIYTTVKLPTPEQGLITSISDNNVSINPEKFYLAQNYPNPFNPSTVISWQLPFASYVTLKIYDLLGREVATLVNEEKSMGSYSVTFDASNLSSGLYYYKLVANPSNVGQASGFVETRKMMLMK